MFTEKLILASGSPRRAEILSAVGCPFELDASGIDETLKPDEDPKAYVQRLALEKAGAVASKRESGLILAADTTVVVDDQLLGQPEDDNDAQRMLKLLSGKWHEVLTGVALLRIGGKPNLGIETTRVRFAVLSQIEIDWYVSTGEPRGKAGAYGIQGKAALFVEEVSGDYFNIVGLPIRLVYKMIKRT
jgi:septum formation protein